MTETQSLLDQIAEARRARDEAAVVLADRNVDGVFVLSGDAERKYVSRRTLLSELEAKLKESGQ